jgi:hypothetical protein
MEEHRIHRLETVSFPPPLGMVPRSNPPPATGTCDSAISGVTVEVVDTNDTAIWVHETSPPSPSTGPPLYKWTIPLPANTLPVTSAPNFLRCRVRFYEGSTPNILTTLITNKFYVTSA